LAERLRQSVQQCDVNGRRVTISIGLATLADLEHPLAAALFDAADLALYTAKAGGRNQVASYRDCHSRRHETPSAPTAAVNP
jgi:PleD family two-component response regulator